MIFRGSYCLLLAALQPTELVNCQKGQSCAGCNSHHQRPAVQHPAGSHEYTHAAQSGERLSGPEETHTPSAQAGSAMSGWAAPTLPSEHSIL